MSPVRRVLAHLANVTRSGKGWTARWPAHKDSHNSLSIHVGNDGRVLLKCHAGCETDEVVRAMGLEMRDLFHGAGDQQRRPGKPGRPKSAITVADLARDKALPINFLLDLGLKDRPDGVLIPYRMTDSSLAPRQRLRTSLEAKDGSVWLIGKGSPVPYGLDRLSVARRAGYLMLVEGESDSWTAWLHGLPALGIPGATMTHILQADLLEGIKRIYIVKEPDRGGETFTAGVAKRCRKIGWKGELLLLCPPLDIKDLNDLHKRDPTGFKTAFQELMHKAKLLDLSGGSQAPVLVCMADVEPVEVDWLWRPYVPLGKLTIVEGDPGIGKTQAAIAVTAAVSRGVLLPSPDGSREQPRQPASVIYMTAEDGLADTIRPRLDAAGADVHRIHCLQAKEVRNGSGVTSLRGITLADIEVIEKALASLRPLLLVVDPLQAYLGSDVDMYRPNETRPLLAGLARSAEQYKCAVLLIRCVFR